MEQAGSLMPSFWVVCSASHKLKQVKQIRQLNAFGAPWKCLLMLLYNAHTWTNHSVIVKLYRSNIRRKTITKYVTDICSSPQMTPNKKSNSYAFSVGSCTPLFLSFLKKNPKYIILSDMIMCIWRLAGKIRFHWLKPDKLQWILYLLSPCEDLIAVVIMKNTAQDQMSVI